MNSLPMQTVLIADDHEIVRHAVRMIIEALPGNFEFYEAGTCVEVTEILSKQKIQFAILDMALSDGDIFASDQQISNYCRKINILVYSMNAEKLYANRLLQMGVRGFVSKRSSVSELKIAISNLLDGEIYLSPSFKETLWNQGKAGRPNNPIETLSDREIQVAEYIIQGMGSKEISWKLSLDITTISTYRRRVFEKLDVQNVIQLKEKFHLYKIHN
jgi:two-component system, NarL family, invasion response regulator UvrY